MEAAVPETRGPVAVGLPGAAGERVARLQLPQQVLPAVLPDQPPCAQAELGRKADGDAACGVVGRTFTWAVSPSCLFSWAEPRVLCGVSMGLGRWCPWYLVFAVCPWY